MKTKINQLEAELADSTEKPVQRAYDTGRGTHRPLGISRMARDMMYGSGVRSPYATGFGYRI